MTVQEKILNLVNDNNWIILDFKISNFYAKSYLIELYVYFKEKETYMDKDFMVEDKNTLMYILSEIIKYCDSHIEERNKYWL